MVFVLVLFVCFKAAIFLSTLIALMAKQNWRLQKQFYIWCSLFNTFPGFLNCKLRTCDVSLSNIPLAFDVCNNNDPSLSKLRPLSLIDSRQNFYKSKSSMMIHRKTALYCIIYSVYLVPCLSINKTYFYFGFIRDSDQIPPYSALDLLYYLMQNSVGGEVCFFQPCPNFNLSCKLKLLKNGFCKWP